MSKRKIETNTNDESVYDLTRIQLRGKIRFLTAEVNARIKRYREAVSAGKFSTGEQRFIERTIETVKKATATKKSGTNEYYIPKGKKDEVGLGLSNKSMPELQKQLQALKRFVKKDISTPTGQEEWSEKVQTQYDTFRMRYNENLSKEEYEDMYDTMNVVKEVLKDYGYEDYGKDYARTYAKANEQGKQKFIRYVKKAKEESDGAGQTTEQILDRVAELLRENGEL